MTKDTSNQATATKHSFYVESALASALFPVISVIFGWILVAIFPATFFGVLILGFLVLVLGFVLSIFSVIGGFRYRVTFAVAVGIIAFVLNGSAAFYALSIWLFLPNLHC